MAMDKEAARARNIDAITHRLAASQTVNAIAAAGFDMALIQWVIENQQKRINALRQPACEAEMESNMAQAVAEVEKAPTKITATVGVFKGNPTISFTKGDKDRFPFTFGLTKASRLVDYAQQNSPEALVTLLREFVEAGKDRE